MNNEIMVTVMVTFYNQKKYIKDSLSAIFNQKTNFKYEVICGDDGSSDGTYEELLEWQKKYPEICTVVQMPREIGKKYEPIIRASNNRWCMLKLAKGKYITFLDGDDYYTDLNKFQKQVDMLEAYPECVGCVHPMKMLWENDPNKKRILGNIADYPLKIRNKIYWAYWWFPAEAFLFRNVYKGKEELINKDFFDDNIITCYFIKHGDIIYIPDNMVVYRQISDSSWNMRNDMEKAVVNMRVYNESKRIVPELKLQCFLKCQSAWRRFYKNRKADLQALNMGQLVENEKVVSDTLKYGNSGMLYKISYEIKYFIPMHMGWVIRNLKKVRKNTFQKIS